MPWIAPRSEPPSPLHVALTLVATLAWVWTFTAHARLVAGASVIALAVLTMVRVRADVGFVHPWAGFPAALGRFVRRPDYSLPSLLFLGYLTSALWSEDYAFLTRHLRLAAQLVGLPAVFFLLAEVYRRFRTPLWVAFVAFAGLSTLGVAVYLLANGDALIVALGQGRAVPTPVQHVRYATALALGTVVGVYLLGWRQVRGAAGVAVAVATAAAFVTIHLIAVRTGLVLVYLGLATLAARFAFARLRWRTAFAALVALAVVAGVALPQIPTVRKKVEYTLYDLHIYERGAASPAADDDASAAASAFSDGARLASLEAGLAIIAAHPWRGAPRGELGAAMQAEYRAAGRAGFTLFPTNQFVFSWAASGLAGLLGLLAVFVAPTLERGWWRRPLLLEWLVMLAALCLVETPFESDIGVGLAAFGIYLAKASELPPPRIAPTTSSVGRADT